MCSFICWVVWACRFSPHLIWFIPRWMIALKSLNVNKLSCHCFVFLTSNEQWPRATVETLQEHSELCCQTRKTPLTSGLSTKNEDGRFLSSVICYYLSQCWGRFQLDETFLYQIQYLSQAVELWHGAFLFGASQFQQLVFPAVSLSWWETSNAAVISAGTIYFKPGRSMRVVTGQIGIKKRLRSITGSGQLLYSAVQRWHYQSGNQSTYLIII